MNFSSEMDRMRQAARDAYQSMGDIVGVTMIPRQERVDAMKNMSVEDLDALAEEYGIDQVLHYIARLSGGKNA